MTDTPIFSQLKAEERARFEAEAQAAIDAMAGQTVSPWRLLRTAIKTWWKQW